MPRFGNPPWKAAKRRMADGPVPRVEHRHCARFGIEAAINTILPREPEHALTMGIERSELIAGVQPVAREAIAELIGRYERVWHW